MTEGHGGWDSGAGWSDPTPDSDEFAEHGMAGEAGLSDGLTDDDGLSHGGADDAGMSDTDPSGEPAGDHADLDGGTGVTEVDDAGDDPAILHAGADDDPLADESAMETTVEGAEWTAPAQPVDADPFPAPLDLDVSPTDGQPWVDPGLLGPDPGDPDAADSTGPPADPTSALLADLHLADGGDGPASMSTLSLSEDPAIRALTAHWAG